MHLKGDAPLRRKRTAAVMQSLRPAATDSGGGSRDEDLLPVRASERQPYTDYMVLLVRPPQVASSAR
jgi:hypothetical protein